MIAQIHGQVLETRLDSLVVSIGGVGLSVMCSPDTIASAQVGKTIALHTSLVVREDSLTLFGFTSAQSRELFELIQSVSGFGPRLAFTIISTMEPEALREAIASEDVGRLTKTPGVGTKGASRLILELKDRIGASKSSGQTTGVAWQAQVEQALIGLGWSAKDAQSAVLTVSTNYDATTSSIPELLKFALQELGK